MDPEVEVFMPERSPSPPPGSGGAPSAGGVLSQAGQPADLMPRFLARLIDYVILFVVNVVIVAVVVIGAIVERRIEDVAHLRKELLPGLQLERRRGDPRPRAVGPVTRESGERRSLCGGRTRSLGGCVAVVPHGAWCWSGYGR